MGAHVYFTVLPVVVYLVTAVTLSVKEPVYYVSMEHMNVTYFNLEYLDFFNATSSRPGRWDPKYYVTAHLGLRRTMYNNSTVDFLFYEFRSNEYRRGFVEMHFSLCDLILKDFFFGPAFRANNVKCPLPRGEHYWTNMSIPDLPLLRTFPFRKGRIYATWTQPDGVRVADGYIDIEIKIRPVRPARSKNMNRTSLVSLVNKLI